MELPPEKPASEKFDSNCITPVSLHLCGDGFSCVVTMYENILKIGRGTQEPNESVN